MVAEITVLTERKLWLVGCLAIKARNQISYHELDGQTRSKKNQVNALFKFSQYSFFLSDQDHFYLNCIHLKVVSLCALIPLSHTLFNCVCLLFNCE